jgi:hypothetical protein
MISNSREQFYYNGLGENFHKISYEKRDLMVSKEYKNIVVVIVFKKLN